MWIGYSTSGGNNSNQVGSSSSAGLQCSTKEGIRVALRSRGSHGKVLLIRSTYCLTYVYTQYRLIHLEIWCIICIYRQKIRLSCLLVYLSTKPLIVKLIDQVNNGHCPKKLAQLLFWCNILSTCFNSLILLGSD